MQYSSRMGDLSLSVYFTEDDVQAEGLYIQEGLLTRMALSILFPMPTTGASTQINTSDWVPFAVIESTVEETTTTQKDKVWRHGEDDEKAYPPSRDNDDSAIYLAETHVQNHFISCTGWEKVKIFQQYGK